MKVNRAVILLKTLNSEELRWMQKFVQSPYHNSNQNLVTLYGMLRKLHPAFPPEKTSPEYLFKKLFPRQPFDAPTIRLLTHRLANLIEAFLVSEQIRHDKVVREKLLVKSLGRRKAFGLFESKTRKLLQTLDESPGRDANYYRHKSDLQLQYYGHPATNRHSKKSEDLQSGMQNLDTYFTLNKLRLASAIKARANTLGEELEIPYMKAVLNQVDEKHTLSRLYHQVYSLQNTPGDQEAFNRLRDTFIENVALFNVDDRRLVLSVLLNFCTRQIHKGDLDFFRETFQLYKLGLENDSIILNNEMTYISYSNIASIAIANKEFEWVKAFIHDYAKYLDKSIQEEAMRYSLGSYYFYQQAFERAYELLNDFNFSKVGIKIVAKSLLARVNIELFLQDHSFYNLALSQLNNLEKSVRTHFRSDQVKVKQHIKFIKFARKYIKLKDSGQSTTALIEKVEQSKNLILKKWLLEKLKE